MDMFRKLEVGVNFGGELLSCNSRFTQLYQNSRFGLGLFGDNPSAQHDTFTPNAVQIYASKTPVPAYLGGSFANAAITAASFSRSCANC
jgi:hypothetical protein